MHVGCNLELTTKSMRGSEKTEVRSEVWEQKESKMRRGSEKTEVRSEVWEQKESKMRRGKMRETEMKTERGSSEGNQRHVEFSITLLGCTVIKARLPWRERRL
ncbi:Hypothetical predicted protein [Xyrichtys novacula]|uniref:Uncharacterized protein n=1 Tax=Xyrichtys novacula TaxID=13765 RepID=A0AAV1H929_XYRNO|nr:Hypothetical predicted protein [Xyrichtys novacula]